MSWQLFSSQLIRGDNDDLGIRALRDGANDLVKKPFTDGELEMRIGYWLARCRVHNTLLHAKLDGSTVLSDMKQQSPTGPFYLKFTWGKKEPEKLTIDEYHDALSATEIKKYELVVDIAGNRAWRNGKQIKSMANKGEKGREKGLSTKGLKLIAAYMRLPNTPIRPSKLGPYDCFNGGSGGEESARSMLLKMRKTLCLNFVLPMTNNPTGNPGDGLYSFSATCKYLLITPDENS